MEDKMDSSAIERLGIMHLEECLLNCGKINPDINYNDKTVSWDGDIYLYSDESKKKEYLEGKCNVQVKSHFCKSQEEFNKPVIKFDVNCADLRNYMNDGGAIYFVVYILKNSNVNKYVIYYNSLLPFDIRKILKSTKENQQTKSIEFEKFPKEEYDIENVVKEFIFHRKMQFSTYDTNFRVFPTDSKEQYRIWFDINKPLLNEKQRYVYREIGDGVYEPVFKCKFTGIKVNDNNIDVSIDGKIYFRNAQITWGKGDAIKNIILNHGLNITGFGKKRSKIKLKKNCNIHEYIQNIKFMIAMKTGAELKIGNIACGTGFDISDDKRVFEYELSSFQKIEDLLLALKVDKDVMVSKLSNKMIDDLITLYRFIVLKEHHYLSDKEKTTQVGKINIGPYNFLIIKKFDELGRASIINPFENDLQCEMSLDRKHKFASSLALWLSQEAYNLFDNIDYNAVKESVIQLPYCNELDDVVTRVILIFLSKYDKTGDKDVLDCATSLAEWLYDKSATMINKINYLQCVHRKGGMEKKDIVSLIEDKKNNDDNEVLAGVNILLNNKDEFDYYFNKLNKKEQNKFKSYPIYTLVKNMK